MALRGDELFLSYGVMGGFMQVRAAYAATVSCKLTLVISRKVMFRSC